MLSIFSYGMNFLKSNIYSKLTASLLFILLLSITASTVFAETGLVTRGFTSTYDLVNLGNKLIYIIDGSSAFQRDLAIKPIRGGAEIKLSNELGSQGDVKSFQVSPDESRVVYKGAKSDGGLVELYSVPISGGASVKLSVAINAPMENIGQYLITPDSKQVVYTVVRSGVFTTLYVVPIDGVASTKIGVESEAIPFSGWQITNDSKFLIFNVFVPDTNYSRYLYKADLSDGSVTPLNDDLGVNGFADSPIQTHDGKNVVYNYVSTVAAETGFYVTSIDDSDSTMLSPSLSPGGAIDNKVIGPNDLFVYYVADQNADGLYRLFRVSLAGGSANEIITNFNAGESISLFSMVVNSTGSHAVFRVDKDGGSDLYSANLTTGLATKLNSGGRVLLDFEVSNDGNYVLFKADSDTQELFELFSVRVGGGSLVKLNREYLNTANAGVSGINFDISEDSKRVAYWVENLNGDFKDEILEVAITGGASTKLSPELPEGSGLGFPRYSSDGSLVIFRINDFDGVRFGVFAFDFQDIEEEICFPILASNGRAAIVCL